jgi:hypothetical protein
MPTVTVKEKPIPTQIRARRGALTSVSLNRSKIADKWLPEYTRSLKAILDRYVRRVSVAMRQGLAFPQTAVDQHVEDYTAAKRRWTVRTAQDGWEQAEKELRLLNALTTGKTGEWSGKDEVPPVLIGGTEETDLAAREVEGRSEEFLLRADFPPMDEWVQTTSLQESETDTERLAQIWKDAEASRDPKTGAAWTTRQMSQAILERGLADNVARADMLARTGTVWAINEGALQRYVTAGVTVTEWLATSDDVTCPFCLTMNNKVVSVDQPYWPAGDTLRVERHDGKVVQLKIPNDVNHPPLHPRCRCTLIPVIRQVRKRVTTPKTPKRTSVERRSRRTKPPAVQRPSRS